MKLKWALLCLVTVAPAIFAGVYFLWYMLQMMSQVML